MPEAMASAVPRRTAVDGGRMTDDAKQDARETALGLILQDHLMRTPGAIARDAFDAGWDAAARTISDGGATDSLVARISTLEAQLAEAREALEEVWYVYEPDEEEDEAGDKDGSYRWCIEHEEEGGVRAEMPYFVIRQVRAALAQITEGA